MIKFDIINNQLCLMLEKPIPLTEDAKSPCVVGYIKDDSLAGRLNKSKAINIGTDYLDTTFIANAIKNNPLYHNAKHAYDARNMCIEPIDQLEILGYPVADNSAEWALYRMMQGDKVTKRHLKHTYWHYDARPHLKCISEYNCGKLQIMVSPEIWIKTADREGWQIYAEPKPCAVCKGTGKVYSCTKKSGKVGDETGSYALSFTYDAVDCPACKEKEIDKPEPKSEPKVQVGDADEISVISPAEVRVKVQLEGTVGICISNVGTDCFSLKTKNTWYAIPYADLDPATAAMVRELIEKQEGDAK